jgi:hypothetical protein
VSALGDENVGGLDVAVNDTGGVRGIERVGDLNSDVEQGLRIKWLFGDAVFQRGAIEELHHDERLSFMPANLVDGADVGMAEC